MRVLYVIDSLAAGGAETSLVHMAPGYPDHGIDLHVAFLRSAWDLAEDLEATGATLHPVALDTGRPRQLAGLVQLIRRLRPDIVHTTLYESDVLGRSAALVARTPSVTTFANSGYSQDHYADPSLKRWKLASAQAVDAATARFAAGFHAVSGTIADEMAHRLRVPRDRIAVIPRARRRDRLGEPTPERRQRTRALLGLGDDQPVVLAAARHEHQKGLDVLMEAIPPLAGSTPGVRVLVAGRDGRETPRLMARMEASNVAQVVRLLGARDDVPDLMVAADVVVVPSRFEGMPGVVLEAMALERPVVASDIPTVRDAIAENAYALVPVGDAIGLSEALARCLADPGRHSVARLARERFDAHFTPDVVVASMRRLYEAAISG